MSTEPIVTGYTHEQAIAVAKKWMLEEYGVPRNMSSEAKERYYERLGLLVDFLHTLHPPYATPAGAKTEEPNLGSCPAPGAINVGTRGEAPGSLIDG